MPSPSDALPAAPISLTGHTVPEERLALIAPHIAALARTALAVSDRVPLGADDGDFIAALEEDADRR